MCAAVVKGRVAPAAARLAAFGPTQVSGASHRPPFAGTNTEELKRGMLYLPNVWM